MLGKEPPCIFVDTEGADAEELVSLELPLELPLVPEDAEPEDELLLEPVFGIETVESTVTTHSAETSPTEAVIVALPSAIAVTFPSSSTVATSGASDVKVIPSIDAPSGFAVAVNCAVPSFFNFREVSLSSILSRSGTTVTTHSAVRSVSLMLAVIVVSPTSTALISPSLLTVATSSLEEVNSIST